MHLPQHLLIIIACVCFIESDKLASKSFWYSFSLDLVALCEAILLHSASGWEGIGVTCQLARRFLAPPACDKRRASMHVFVACIISLPTSLGISG